MNSKIADILEDKLSEDWERFARCSEFTDDLSVNAIIEHINGDYNKCDIKSKMKCLLKKLYEHHPKDYNEYIKKSLIHMNRNDLLLDLSTLALKSYYIKIYSQVDKLQTPLKIPATVNLLLTFVVPCIVDEVNTQINAVYSDERDKFLKKQKSYNPIQYEDVFNKEKSVILISGIAGIGKTWFLRKCLLDWSNDSILKNFSLVFYFECRRLNQHQDISSVNELLNILYKDAVNDFYISNHTDISKALFIIDGIDEFKYLKEFVKYLKKIKNKENLSCNYGIVKTLAEIQKYKYVFAGRVYAVDLYQSIFTDHSDKLTVQIMGFNEKGINSYIKNKVLEESQDAIKTTLKESSIAKSMASVPFYLSTMCNIISNSKIYKENSFLTMTDLYANIFLYFLKAHIIKNNELVYKMMENEIYKKYVLNICQIAYELFIENKLIFKKEEIISFIKNFDELENNLFGFIERFETDVGIFYQFAHLTIMEFCVSVYAYNMFSGQEIVGNKKLRSCLSMICGLNNKSKNSLTKFLVNLNPSKSFDDPLPLFCFIGMDTRVVDILVNKVSEDWERFARCSEFKDDLSIKAIIDCINGDENTGDAKLKMKCLLTKLYVQHPKDYKVCIEKALKHLSRNDVLQDISNLDPEEKIDLGKSNEKLFIECFYESQSSFTSEIKSFVDGHKWWNISINNGKTTYEISCDNYFVNHFINSGGKLSLLEVHKNNFSDEEKNILIKCSINVDQVDFYCPINLKGWEPKDNIKTLEIRIAEYLISKEDFENFVPWINLCEKLYIFLHDDIDFIKDIIKWVRYSKIKLFGIRYLGKYFYSLRRLKFFIRRKQMFNTIF